MEGSMPRRQVRLVEAWAELHQEELARDWQRLQEGQRPLPIERSSKGASVMKHGIYRVQSFDILSPYTLRIRFDDETEQVINFEPVLVGELFGPLRDLELFNQVRIDHEVHTLVWPNGSDFEAATLHDWHDVVDDMVAGARPWESVPA